MEIEIEQMLFGDYRVQVWDKNLNSLLDREYFCRGYEAALLTALEIQKSLFKGFPVFLRSGETKIKLSNGWEKNE